MSKVPNRLHDVRVTITHSMWSNYNRFWRGPRKGTILDGRLDEEGNFHAKWKSPANGRAFNLTVYPSHFRVLGKFYFRKIKT